MVTKLLCQTCASGSNGRERRGVCGRPRQAVAAMWWPYAGDGWAGRCYLCYLSLLGPSTRVSTTRTDDELASK